MKTISWKKNSIIMLKNKQKTIAEKATEILLNPNGIASDSDSADEETAPRIIEYDEDEYELPQAGTTDFRKQNVKLLSQQSAKYKGKIAYRKDFESDEHDECEKDSSDDELPINALSNATKGKRYNNAAEEDSELERNSNENEESDDEVHDETDSENVLDEGDDSDNCIDEGDDSDNVTDEEVDSGDDEDTEVISKVNHEAEIQKGICVQNQLHIWERLLEMRINLQKLLIKTNQLPDPQHLKKLSSNNDKHKDIQQITCKQSCQLLQNLLSLKNNLCTQFSEVEKAIKPCLKRHLSFKDSNSGEPPLKQISEHLQESFDTFRPYRNSVLLKWDDRTKLLQPGGNSKKKTFNEDFDIIKKIDNALINKTQLKEKSQQLNNETQNKSGEDVRNPNIYDDSDFYHQQLRELIEYKANSTNNMSEVTKQFLELQKLRQKMKKKVDSRASKGRKLRYIVHNKLINFMAPHDNISWTMESIDELSKSLFA